MEMSLISLIDRYRCIACGAVFDLLPSDVEVHQVIRPINLLCRSWRNQNLFAGPPVLRIDEEVLDAPIGIFDEKVLDLTDFAVAGVDMIPSDRSDATQMRIVFVSLSSGNILLKQLGIRDRRHWHGATPVTVATHKATGTPIGCQP